MPRSPSKNSRREARALALQVLYEIDVARHDQALVLMDHLTEAAFDEPRERFVREMVVGIRRDLATLDEHIQQIAPEWPVAQMSPVDRNILRMALFELLSQPTTPVKVAINEAVELARSFGSESSHRFVNGALGTFAARHLPRGGARPSADEPESDGEPDAIDEAERDGEPPADGESDGAE